MQMILLWKMQPCLYFCMINLMQYTSDSFESIIVSVNVKVMYFSNVQRFLFAHLRTFHKVLVMTPVHMKITIFVKKKISFSNFLCWSQGEFICVFVLSRGGYIAQWHRSTQVVQHSRDGQSAEQRQPPHQQTDGRGGAWKAPGTLQWKVGPENVSHLIPSERCLLRNFTWAWRIFTQF